MDTFKENEVLEHLPDHGPAPWELREKQGPLSIVSDDGGSCPSPHGVSELVAVLASEDR